MSGLVYVLISPNLTSSYDVLRPDMSTACCRLTKAASRANDASKLSGILTGSRVKCRRISTSSTLQATKQAKTPPKRPKGPQEEYKCVPPPILLVMIQDQLPNTCRCVESRPAEPNILLAVQQQHHHVPILYATEPFHFYSVA